MDVAIRDAMLPKLDAATFFQQLREIGVSSIEIEVQPGDLTPHLLREDGTPYSLADEASVRALRRRLDAEGVRACAVLACTDFSSPEADAHVEYAARAARAARELGAPVVRVDPLVRDKSLGADTVRENFVRRTADLLRRTEDVGVDFGIENHGPIANDPAFLDAVLAAVPDPRIGLTLDTGNFYWFGFPRDAVYGLIEKYAPRTKHTHLKNINFPADVAGRRRETGFEYKQYCCPLHEGNLDLQRIVKILRSAGYGRDLCVEDESLFKQTAEQRPGVLQREVEAVREAMEGTR
jgi:sugar phosphate isomerase/epimerase